EFTMRFVTPPSVEQEKSGDFTGRFEARGSFEPAPKTPSTGSAESVFSERVSFADTPPAPPAPVAPSPAVEPEAFTRRFGFPARPVLNDDVPLKEWSPVPPPVG